MTDEIPGTTPGEVEGYQAPAEPEGEAPPSEIPTGVDALPAEAVAAAEERSGADGGDGGGALDVSAIMAEGGDDAQAGAADETGDDATEKTDPEAQASADTGEVA